VNGDGFLLELALVAVLILLNGFFAGAEIAVISARTSHIRPLAERGSRRAASLLRLKANPDRFLATVQIGVTLVGCAVVVAVNLLADLIAIRLDPRIAVERA